MTTFKSRRRFTKGLGALLGASGLLSPMRSRGANPGLLDPTPACAGHRTIRQTPGPFFTPHTPHRRDFAVDDPDGSPFTLVGFVRNRKCEIVENAMVELWHTDSLGRYDNSGYRMRGHQFTDAQGRFLFNTIVPGDYPSRTKHFHVTVLIPGKTELTTQLYWPRYKNNKGDWIHKSELEMTVGEIDGIAAGRFDFVI
ncbi:MAG: intradiol ring-cleavage dioxygenase [Pseudomonadota bacterium]